MAICEQCGESLTIGGDSRGSVLCGRCLSKGVLADGDIASWLSATGDGTGDDDTDGEDQRDIGGWTIGERLGEGAFGVVYRAHQQQPLNRDGALKLLRREHVSREMLSRFDAERQALARLNHPGIANVLDAGETDEGQPWFVMELVDGQSVTDFCEQENLDLRQRLELMAKICDALQHAHENGVVHRDLKPSNIMVGGDADDCHVKIIDFGVAKATAMPLTERTLYTHAGVLIGTPEYMSPEQASGRPMDITARADVYSLGVLLFEMLTGEPPLTRGEIEERTFDETLRAVREMEVPRPSTRIGRTPTVETPQTGVSKIASDVDWIVLKATEKTADRRYGDAGELAADVRRFLDFEPVEARRSNAVYQARMFVRRHRRGLGLVAAVVLGGMITVGLLLLQKREESQFSTMAEESWRPVSFRGFYAETERNLGVDYRSSISTADFPYEIMKICQNLRESPGDDHARMRLWGLLAIVGYPVPVGDPFSAEGRIRDAVFLPDIDYAVTVSEDGMLHVVSAVSGKVEWQVDAGEPLERVLAGTEGRIAICGVNGTLQMVNCVDRQLASRIETGGPISAGQFLSAGTLPAFVIAGNDGRLSSWSAIDGSRLWEMDAGFAVRSFAFSEDQSLGACGMENGRFIVFDTASGMAQANSFDADSAVVGINFYEKTKVLMVALESGEVVYWNRDTMSIARRYQGHTGPISSVAVSSGEHWMLTASGNGTIRAWLGGGGNDYHRMYGAGRVRTITMNAPTPRIMGMVDDKGEFRLWDYSSRSFRSEPMHFPHRNSGDQGLIVLHPVGYRFLMANDQQAQISRRHPSKADSGSYLGAGFVTGVGFPGDGSKVRFVGLAGMCQYEIKGHHPDGVVMAIPPAASLTVISRNGEWIAAAYGTKVQLWNYPAEGSPVPARVVKVESKVTALALAPDGRQLSVGCADGSFGVWTTAQSKRRVRGQATGEGAIRSTCVADDLAVFGSEQGGVHAVDLNRRKEVEVPLVFSAAVDSVAISPRGVVAAGARDGICRLYDFKEERKIGGDLQHSGGVFCITFNPDGRWLVCGTRTGYSKFWNARDGRYLFQTKQQNGEMIFNEFTPDERRFVQGSTFREPGVLFLPPSNAAISERVLNLAEAWVGGRIDSDGKRIAVPYERLEAIRREIQDFTLSGSESDYELEVVRWEKWLAELVENRIVKRDPMKPSVAH